MSSPTPDAVRVDDIQLPMKPKTRARRAGGENRASTPPEPWNVVVLRLFGGFMIESEGGEVIHVPLRKAQALLAYLACSLGTPASRETLASLLWGECEHHRARQNLRQVLLALRRALARSDIPVLHMEGQLVWLDASSIWIDVVAFDGVLARGTPEGLADAAALYHGGFLAGLQVHAPDFDEWVVAWRARFEERLMSALGDLLAHQHAAGQFDLAIETGNRALGIDPCREDIHRELMRLYLAKDMRTSALTQFRRCHDVLKHELGVSPEEATSALYRSIVDADPDDGSPHAEDPPPSLEHATSPAPWPGWRSLIGRQEELSALDRELAGAVYGRCRLLLVVGEAGVGKTHLIEAFCHRLAGRRARVLRTRARPAERGLPLSLWADLLGDECIDHYPFGEKGACVEVVEWPAGSKPSPDPTADWCGGPTAQRLRLYDTVVQHIRSRAADRPLVLVVDDLHWADQDSLHLLEYAVRHLGRHPVLFVGTAPSGEAEDASPLWRKMQDLTRDRTLSRLLLLPLSRKQTRDLCAQWHIAVGRKPLAAARFPEIWALSEGNPRIVIECLLAQENSRDAERGTGYRLPDAVRRELLRLLAPLSETARELLAIACAAGQRCDYDVLRRAASLEEGAMLRAVQDLVAAKVLRLVDRDVVFARGRVRVALYHDLLAPRRRSLHAAVARAIAQVHAHSLEPHHQVLAHHWREADRPSEACRHDVSAGLVQLDKGHHARARRSFQRALQVATGRLADGDSGHALAADARLGLVAIAEIDQNVEAAWNLLRVLDANLERIEGARRRAAVLYGLARIHGVLKDYDAAFGYAQRTLVECEDGGPNPVWLPAERILFHLPAAGAESERVVEDLRDAQQRSRTFGLRRSEANATATLAVLCALRGEFDVAFAEAETSVHLAESLADECFLAACLQVLGMVLAWHGDAAEALDHLDKAATIAEARCDLIRLCALSGHRGRALHIGRRPVEALRQLTRAVAMARRLGTRVYLPLFTAWQAGSLFEVGDAAGALRQACATFRLAADANQPWPCSLAHRTVARVLSDPEVRDLTRAGRAVNDALAIQRGLGPSFELARTLSVQAKVLKATGNLLGSSDHYAEAGRLYDRMHMPAARDQARRRASLLRSVDNTVA